MMQMDRIAVAVMVSALNNSLPAAIFDIRHTKFDILRAMNRARAIFEAARLERPRARVRHYDSCRRRPDNLVGYGVVADGCTL